jgi:PEP-CTERM motif
MRKQQFGSAAGAVLAVTLVVLTTFQPVAAQVSLYHMDFKPADFNPASPGLVAGEANVGPNNFAMPGFGWDEIHGQAGRPGVYFPNVAGSNPEDPNNRAFVFLFGAAAQTSSTFTSTATPGSTFPATGINPTLPANAGLGITWAQHLENTASGNPVHVRVALQIAGGNWYVSNGVFDTGTVGAGSQGNFDPQALLYNPAKANWLNLTIGATAVDGVTIGSAPASDLSGNITGIGFVASFVIQSTVHIDYVDVGIPPVPGDVNGDRIVDLVNDYAIIRSHFGTNVASRSLGDVTGDGMVNLLDFAQWKDHYPFPAGGDGSLEFFDHLLASVPEPSALLLLAVGLTLSSGWSRRRRGPAALPRVGSW